MFKRWLIIYTKDIYSHEDIEKLKDFIGNPLQTQWYMFPSEYIKSVKIIGWFRNKLLTSKKQIKKAIIKVRNLDNKIRLLDNGPYEWEGGDK